MEVGKKYMHVQTGTQKRNVSWKGDLGNYRGIYSRGEGCEQPGRLYVLSDYRPSTHLRECHLEIGERRVDPLEK